MTAPLAKMARPRLGFLGMGWMGRNRLEKIAASGIADIVAIADNNPSAAEEALQAVPHVGLARCLDELLAANLDGVVIATPSALHAEQAQLALQRGTAVFCQSPLGRTSKEARRVVHAARSARRLLGVDLPYRHVAGVERIRHLAQSGALGDVYAVSLVFHSAHGPDKAWSYDPALAGGGCLIDLGIHLLDLVLWILGPQELRVLASRCLAGGKPLASMPGTVEDYVAAQLETDGGAAVSLTCSWRLPLGCDCFVEAAFVGTRGSATLRNVGGSFYDFAVEHVDASGRHLLAAGPDPWAGRAAVAWAEQLAAGMEFDPVIEGVLYVSRTLDELYGRR